MDKLCKHCNQTSDDGDGKCRFCGTPFPPEGQSQEDPDDLDPSIA